ncbi:MAG: thioesterase family protein [Myxococcales bacterium]|nr:acyl-CoA thioesterase [Polyangiaceae bacterium]MDW8249016.1 thioesterase family protein [Myxococcales bacterium]
MSNANPPRLAPADVERTPLTVRFCETDLMGIVHHGNYLRYFEVGRVAWFKARGATFDHWEGFQLPVVEARLRYRKPARFDDELVIETWVSERRGASVRFSYRILRGDEVLCEGDTLLACVGPGLQPRRFPDFLRRVLPDLPGS